MRVKYWLIAAFAVFTIWMVYEAGKTFDAVQANMTEQINRVR